MADIQEIFNDPAKLREVTKAAFDQVDADGSGKIDKNELKRGLALVAEEAGLPVLSDAAIEDAMNALDTDRSGTLEVDEFQVLIEAILRALASA